MCVHVGPPLIKALAMHTRCFNQNLDRVLCDVCRGEW